MPTVARAMLAIGSVLVSGIAGTPDLAAAILNLSLPVLTSSLSDSTIEFPESRKHGVAVGISLLPCIEAEIQVLPVRPPPS